MNINEHITHNKKHDYPKLHNEFWCHVPLGCKCPKNHWTLWFLRGLDALFAGGLASPTHQFWDPMILRTWAFFRRFFVVFYQTNSQVGLLFWAKQTQFILMLPPFLICILTSSAAKWHRPHLVPQRLALQKCFQSKKWSWWRLGVGNPFHQNGNWCWQKKSWLSFSTQTIHPNVENIGGLQLLSSLSSFLHRAVHSTRVIRLPSPTSSVPARGKGQVRPLGRGTSFNLKISHLWKRKIIF